MSYGDLRKTGERRRRRIGVELRRDSPFQNPGQFDKIEVAGDVTLAGELAIDILLGYTRARGDRFEFLTVGGARTGEFTGLAEGALAGTFPEFGLVITYEAGGGNDVALFPAGFAGDLIPDGELTVADIDEAYRLIRDGGLPAIASAEPDPNPVGVIDKANVDFLVRDLLGTEYGDANLDRTVGNADFGTILGNFAAMGVGWAGGDLNGDGVVGNGDFE